MMIYRMMDPDDDGDDGIEEEDVLDMLSAFSGIQQVKFMGELMEEKRNQSEPKSTEDVAAPIWDDAMQSALDKHMLKDLHTRNWVNLLTLAREMAHNSDHKRIADSSKDLFTNFPIEKVVWVNALPMLMYKDNEHVPHPVLAFTGGQMQETRYHIEMVIVFDGIQPFSWLTVDFGKNHKAAQEFGAKVMRLLNSGARDVTDKPE